MINIFKYLLFYVFITKHFLLTKTIIKDFSEKHDWILCFSILGLIFDKFIALHPVYFNSWVFVFFWEFLLLFLFFLWQSYYVAHIGLEFMIILPQPPRCWDYTQMILGFKWLQSWKRIAKKCLFLNSKSKNRTHDSWDCKNFTLFITPL
jgi:hypothetical protein